MKLESCEGLRSAVIWNFHLRRGSDYGASSDCWLAAGILRLSKSGQDRKNFQRRCGTQIVEVGFVGRVLGERSGGVGAVTVRCRSGGESAEAEGKKAPLKKGSAVVVTEAPPLLKTAEPMPMMRPNNGLINVGDAGRIIDRRPKDTWAVRFAVGAYLIDRKYFEPLEL